VQQGQVEAEDHRHHLRQHHPREDLGTDDVEGAASAAIEELDDRPGEGRRVGRCDDLIGGHVEGGPIPQAIDELVDEVLARRLLAEHT